MSERQFVRDLMKVGVPKCAPDTPLAEAAQFLLDQDQESLIILDQDGHAMGIIGQTELVEAMLQDDWGSLTAMDVMRQDIPQVPPEIPLTAAAQLMADHKVRIFHLMHNAAGIIYPAAFLSLDHFLRHLAARDSSELDDLGIKAVRMSPIEAFKKRRDEARQRNMGGGNEK